MQAIAQFENVTNTVAATQKITADMGKDFYAWLDVMPETARAYRAAGKRLFAWLAEKGISQPARTDILAFRDDLKATCSPATVSVYLTGVRQFFQWTEDNALYPNIASHVKGAKTDRDRHSRECLPVDGIRAMLTAASTEDNGLSALRDYAIISLMATTGLRCVQVVRANLGDYRAMAIGNSVEMVLYHQGKGHEDRSAFVKVSPDVRKAIDAWLAASGDRKATEPLFCSLATNSRGGRLTTRSVSRIAKSLMRTVGMDRRTMTAHSLRHTAATIALANGEALEDIQHMLDHASITTTQIYAHSFARAKSTCETTVSSVIFGR